MVVTLDTLDKTEITALRKAIKSLVSLQLAGAIVGRNGKISVRELFTNINRFAQWPDLDYPTFLQNMEEIRDSFKCRDGAIGVDVDYISLRDD